MSSSTLIYISTTTDLVIAIATIFLLIVAIEGLGQISEARSARIIQAKRDSLHYSDEIVNYYLEKIAPLHREVRALAVSAGIIEVQPVSFIEPEKIADSAISNGEIDDVNSNLRGAKDKKLAAQYYLAHADLINRLEKICLMINLKLADEEEVYNCVGGVLMSIINKYNRNIRLNRRTSLDNGKYVPYKNIESLYIRWHTRKLLEEKTRRRDTGTKEATQAQEEIESLIAQGTLYKTSPIGVGD
jgi:hypothetical protein